MIDFFFFNKMFLPILMFFLKVSKSERKKFVIKVLMLLKISEKKNINKISYHISIKFKKEKVKILALF